MTNLTSEQEALRASIKKSAIIWGVVLGLIIAGLAYWLLGSQGTGIRSGGAALAGLLFFPVAVARRHLFVYIYLVKYYLRALALRRWNLDPEELPFGENAGK